MKLAVVGTGAFARTLIPLFKAHPLVDAIALCDLDAAKLQAASRELGIPETYPSLDAVCDSSVDAVAIITQHWLHGPHALQALRAGKHVFSAVPSGITVDEVAALVRAVEETGQIYMIGETSYYYPWVIYCRQRYATGDFGHVVYAEAEYYHDLHRLAPVFQRRGGEAWREAAVIPPMYYPTHSTSEIISVTGAYMTHVSCQGFVDREADGIFQPAISRWGNAFSNEVALCRMSDGSSCRINGFWRVGHPGGVRLNMFGTEGSFEHNSAGAVWLTRDRARQTRLDDLFASTGITTEAGTFLDLAKIHPVDALPRAFAGLPNGHAGTHYFIVDEFARACAEGRQPANNVWAAARYTAPGIIAHESAVRGGTLLEIPDFGDPPTA